MGRHPVSAMLLSFITVNLRSSLLSRGPTCSATKAGEVFPVKRELERTMDVYIRSDSNSSVSVLQSPLSLSTQVIQQNVQHISLRSQHRYLIPGSQSYQIQPNHSRCQAGP